MKIEDTKQYLSVEENQSTWRKPLWNPSSCCARAQYHPQNSAILHTIWIKLSSVSFKGLEIISTGEEVGGKVFGWEEMDMDTGKWDVDIEIRARKGGILARNPLEQTLLGLPVGYLLAHCNYASWTVFELCYFIWNKKSFCLVTNFLNHVTDLNSQVSPLENTNVQMESICTEYKKTTWCGFDLKYALIRCW